MRSDSGADNPVSLFHLCQGERAANPRPIQESWACGAPDTRVHSVGPGPHLQVEAVGEMKAARERPGWVKKDCLSHVTDMQAASDLLSPGTRARTWPLRPATGCRSARRDARTRTGPGPERVRPTQRRARR